MAARGVFGRARGPGNSSPFSEPLLMDLVQDFDNLEDTSAPPIKRRRITRAVDRPDVMEATTETRNGFIRIAISQDDASFLEAILKTGTVHLLLPLKDA